MKTKQKEVASADLAQLSEAVRTASPQHQMVAKENSKVAGVGRFEINSNRLAKGRAALLRTEIHGDFEAFELDASDEDIELASVIFHEYFRQSCAGFAAAIRRICFSPLDAAAEQKAGDAT